MGWLRAIERMPRSTAIGFDGWQLDEHSVSGLVRGLLSIANLLRLDRVYISSCSGVRSLGSPGARNSACSVIYKLSTVHGYYVVAVRPATSGSSRTETAAIRRLFTIWLEHATATLPATLLGPQLGKDRPQR